MMKRIDVAATEESRQLPYILLQLLVEMSRFVQIWQPCRIGRVLKGQYKSNVHMHGRLYYHACVLLCDVCTCMCVHCTALPAIF